MIKKEDLKLGDMITNGNWDILITRERLQEGWLDFLDNGEYVMAKSTPEREEYTRRYFTQKNEHYISRGV